MQHLEVSCAVRRFFFKSFGFKGLIKNGARICPVYLSEFVSQKRVYRIYLHALIAHHTPTVMSCTVPRVLPSDCLPTSMLFRVFA